MHWNKVFPVIFGLLIAGSALHAQDSTGTRPLWNVTKAGDTLQYVNIIPARSPFHSIDGPQYLTRMEWNNLVDQVSDSTFTEYAFTDVRLSGISIDPELDRIRELESTHRSLWKPIVSMVISGAISAYYKLEANESYDRYRRSLDQSSIQYYYDQTKKYDTYSTISFVIFQGSFGWMIYKLIR